MEEDVKEDIETKLVFAYSKETPENPNKTLLIGLPEGAIEHMQKGLTHNLDLNPLGVNMRFVLFSAKDHAEAIKTVEDVIEQGGGIPVDNRDKDFSIPQK